MRYEVSLETFRLPLRLVAGLLVWKKGPPSALTMDSAWAWRKALEGSTQVRCQIQIIRHEQKLNTSLTGLVVGLFVGDDVVTGILVGDGEG